MNNQSSLAHYVIHSRSSLPTATCWVHDYQYIHETYNAQLKMSLISDQFSEIDS